MLSIALYSLATIIVLCILTIAAGKFIAVGTGRDANSISNDDLP